MIVLQLKLTQEWNDERFRSYLNDTSATMSKPGSFPGRSNKETLVRLNKVPSYLLVIDNKDKHHKQSSLSSVPSDLRDKLSQGKCNKHPQQVSTPTPSFVRHQEVSQTFLFP